MNASLAYLSGEHWAEAVPPETHRLAADVDTDAFLWRAIPLRRETGTKIFVRINVIIPLHYFINHNA